ncbi:MAG: alkaline phosphatase family protein [Acidobacteria bacterium]|nr:alkaline phosphatase family protein [Acidobacteriota bacterium]
MRRGTRGGRRVTQDLEKARSELKRLGYLSHGYDRYLLQDALRPRQPLRTVGLLVLKVALAGGVLFALVLAFGLAAVNGNLAATPFDLIPLFLHLLPVSAFAVGLGFLALCAFLVGVLRVYPVRRIEVLSFAVAVVAGVILVLVASGRLLDLWSGSERWTAVTFALALPLAVFALVRLVESGLLTLAIRLTELTPERQSFGRRWLVAAGLVALALISLPAVLSVAADEQPARDSFPSAPGDRVLLVGVDGVLPAELDYLLARKQLPELGRLLDEGGATWTYERQHEPPAVFWTTIATGLGASGHGVSALDSFRPLGVATPLSASGPLRAYWSSVAVPLGLAEYRPVLANRRHAYTLWELASRGGRPVVAINWWATFPAEALPGLVVAHGAYQLLADGAGDAMASTSRPDLLARIRQLRNSVPPGVEGQIVRAALNDPERVEDVLERAVLPDRFYLDALEEALPASPRVAALYLPGPDLAADGWQGGSVGYSDLVRAELEELDEVLGRHAAQFGTLAVVLDPGRRGGTEGRILLWRRGVECAPSSGLKVEPHDLTAALLRVLGLPQSSQLPEPPGACGWPEAPARIQAFGRRQPAAPSATSDSEEYLQSLRSLGYL